MSERPVELQPILNEVRRRWTRRMRLRAWATGAVVAAVILVSGVVATWLVGTAGLPLVVTVGVSAALAAVALGWAMWTIPSPPSDRHFSRFIEERLTDLDDVVVTAVDYAQRPQRDEAIAGLLDREAAAALATRDLDQVVSRASLSQWSWRAAAASAALAIVSVAFLPPLSRATNVALAYLLPARVSIDVTPGAAKVRAGEAMTLSARLHGAGADLTPIMTVTVGNETRQVAMAPGSEPGLFSLTIERVTASFAYAVTAAATRSPEYTVTVIRPPRVERIDVEYQFPRELGLAPRTDADSGDLYGPSGTKARLTITADKPIVSADLVLADGRKVPLAAAADRLDGGLTIEGNSSYRIALVDADGLTSDGDTDYFIRTMADRPPDVRIVRPASDRQVTALEEVRVEATADDDHGIGSFELVFQTPSGKERSVALAAGGIAVTGAHTLFLEELGVQPGDFVSYYARARDVGRGRRPVEARSDIFFLEVKPFEEEFVAAQSQAMGQAGGMQNATGLEELTEAQKEIIVATWKLDARARRARDAASERDIKAVATAQTALRTRAEQASGQLARANDPRRRRNPQGPAPGDDPLGRAIESMGRAASDLGTFDTAKALPHEMEALNQLLKAQADIRRRQVTRGQQAGGGGGMNRAEADLSTLFDHELRRRQQTNYETPNSTETRAETAAQDDPLDQIRDLARRQDGVNERQRDLAANRDKLDIEELKRQLERLTREQNELRQQAEQLAQQMAHARQQSRSQPASGQSQSEGQQSRQGGQSGESGASGSQAQRESQSMRQISEDMRAAATGMNRQEGDRAAESGNRAAERLRQLERQLQTERPDDRRRALGDLQLETRQLADAQRRVAAEAGRTRAGQAGDDARRRLSGEQERLAERATRLDEQVQQMARAAQAEDDAGERRATAEAARELTRQRIADRMRESAAGLRRGDESTGDGAASPARDAARQGEELAKALDQVADRLGAGAGARDADTQRLSDQLAKTQQLRDTVAALDRQLSELQKEAAAAGVAGDDGPSPATPSGPRGGQPSQSPPNTDPSATGQQAGQGAEGNAAQQGSGAASGGRGARLAQLEREVSASMREAERLSGELRRDNPGQQSNPDATWWRTFAAPGTEAFKQDFARWESLKKNLFVAIEDVEASVSNQLRARETNQRLNAGGHEAVSEAYRALVDQYYRSLAQPRHKK